MYRFIIGLGICFSIVFCIATACTAANTDAGLRMYHNGELNQAKEYFETQARLKPQDAYCRYMLGNVFMKLNQPVSAATEYENASKLEPNSASAKYSLHALEHLRNKNNYSTSISETMSPVKQSVIKASRELNAIQLKEQRECDTKVEQIFRKADDLVQEIEKSATGQEYLSEIKRIKEQARRDADAIIIGAKKKAIAREEALLSLYRTYIQEGDKTNIVLKPSKTDLYLRNYLTKDPVASDEIPLIAYPKPLSTKKLKDSIK